ncbi:MAG: hypothetical protein AAF846_06850 [Chloroflexota bacterium]
MRWFEDVINAMTDMDWQWYPYLALRPEKDEKMTTLYILRLTLWHLPMLVLFSLIMIFFLPPISIAGLAPPISMMLTALFYFMLAYFILMRLIVAPAWNRRANRLHKEKRKPDISRLSEHLVDTDALPLARDFTEPTESRVSLIGNRTED